MQRERKLISSPLAIPMQLRCNSVADFDLSRRLSMVRRKPGVCSPMNWQDCSSHASLVRSRRY
jgi:hypothetical protein